MLSLQNNQKLDFWSVRLQFWSAHYFDHGFGEANG